MADSRLATPNPRSLSELFYSDPSQLGIFRSVEPAAVPGPYQELLVHENHMTVTVERYHGGPVDVDVLATHTTGHHYARKILLRRHSDRKVVQFGIMRLNFRHVSEEVRQEVESQRTPLGRVLIQHNVLREIRLLQLWQVEMGPDLQMLFGLPEQQWTYGRTALIDVDGEPAVELLEIVIPG